MDSDRKSQIVSLMQILEKETEEDRILRTLKRLNKFTMTVDILQETGIGKMVNQFRKREDQVGPVAKALVNKWKQDVAKLIADSAEREASPSTKRSPSPEPSQNAKRQKTEHHSKERRESHKSGSSSHKSESSSHRRESSSHKSDRRDSDKNGLGDEGKDRHKDSRSRHSDKDRHRSDKSRHHDSSKERRHESSKDRRHESSKKHGESSKHGERHRESSKSKHGESSKHDSSRKHESSSKAEMDLSKSLSELSSGSGSETKCARRKERKSTLSQFEVPTPPVVGLQECDILASLPQTVTHYKPLPHINQSPSKRRATDEEIGAKKHSRSVMYSGKKSRVIAKVPTLFEACLEVLMDNVDKIECVGPTPYHVFKPVLQKCTPEQLYNIENYNPHFLEDTDELWEEHCKKQFRGKQRNTDDCETWRELYIRCYEEREVKLKKLTANISAQHTALKDAGRKTKLAFVETLAKPPRDVLRKQKIHGTGGPVHKTVDPLERLSSRGGHPGKSSIRAPIMRNQVTNDVVSPPSVRPANKKPSTAPMMARTMRMMKKMRR